MSYSWMSVTNYDDAVKELALSLPDGCTDGGSPCPNCGRVGSFNITRDGNTLKYICFRVACTCYGNTGSRGTNTGVQTISKKVKLFDGELTMLTDEEYAYLSTARSGARAGRPSGSDALSAPRPNGRRSGP